MVLNLIRADRLASSSQRLPSLFGIKIRVIIFLVLKAYPWHIWTCVLCDCLKFRLALSWRILGLGQSLVHCFLIIAKSIKLGFNIRRVISDLTFNQVIFKRIMLAIAWTVTSRSLLQISHIPVIFPQAIVKLIILRACNWTNLKSTLVYSIHQFLLTFRLAYTM